MPRKKWQNLIHKKCPKCDRKLQWRDKVFLCLSPDCEGFAISREKLVVILTDQTHIMRRFASPHELELIENAIVEITSNMA